MNKKKKLIIQIVLFIILLIAITAGYNYVTNKNIEDSTLEKDLKNSKEGEKVEIIEIKSAEQFEKEVTNERGVVFIDFYATWCMPCKTMTPIIEEISKEYKEVKFVKIDIDKNEELAIKYNVMSIPTMLIMNNGEVTKTFVGVTNKENIVKEF